MKPVCLILLAGFVLLGSIPPSNAQHSREWIASGSIVQKAEFPLYSTNRELLAVVHVDRAYVDHERKGFFKIGTLPLAAFENVRVDVRDHNRLQDALLSFHSFLNPGNKNRLEIRRLTILVENEPRIQAGLARSSAEGQWELTREITWTDSAAKVTAPQATLQISGPSAGRLILHTSPPTTNQLFTVSQTASLPRISL
jgi:hypothetical protein